MKEKFIEFMQQVKSNDFDFLYDKDIKRYFFIIKIQYTKLAKTPWYLYLEDLDEDLDLRWSPKYSKPCDENEIKCYEILKPYIEKFKLNLKLQQKLKQKNTKQGVKKI